MNKRLTALVIGNSTYMQGGQLINPKNDADDIATILASRHFTVIKRTDCTYRDMDYALKDFRTSLNNSDVGLFFFAGHGMQINGENYLAAVDTDIANETDAKHSSLALNRIIETMEKSETATNIIILDACRDNPFERAWYRSASMRGLAPVYAPQGTIIAFATSPGQIASDGIGRNGAYTASLLKHIDTPDCSLESMFKRVRNTLNAATGGKQISWEHTSLAGEFFFNLSLGVRIDEYSETALSDSIFVLDDSEPLHEIIRGLKSHNWYHQNAAINKITAELVNKATCDSIFVLGRNIYQAACGGSNDASAYLNTFMTMTKSFAKDRRKALIDGMLFEIFFNSRAQIRIQPKNRYFEEVFNLQQYKDEFSESFAFIAECLLEYSDHFHAIPGKSRQITVDVVSGKNAENKYMIQEVQFDGTNILWIEDDGFGFPDTVFDFEELSIKAFEKRLSNEMLVPSRLLTVTYMFDKNLKPRLLFPEDGTMCKRQMNHLTP